MNDPVKCAETEIVANYGYKPGDTIRISGAKHGNGTYLILNVMSVSGASTMEIQRRTLWVRICEAWVRFATRIKGAKGK